MLQSMRSAAMYVWGFIALAFIGGFVFYESSGLFNSNALTTSTAVGSVNRQDILYTAWANARENAVREEEQRTGHSLTLEERERVGQQVFDQMVNDILLQQEYRRRGITVSDDEIREAAQYMPPPELMQSPDLQTDGRFDPEKYRRFLSTPVARQGGLLAQLETYYRSEIPKQKLYGELVSDVYISDGRLWEMWKDAHDSAKITFAVLRPDRAPPGLVAAERDPAFCFHPAVISRLLRLCASGGHWAAAATWRSTSARRTRSCSSAGAGSCCSSRPSSRSPRTPARCTRSAPRRSG